MITVTKRAREKLKRSVLANIQEPGMSLRLEAAAPGTLGLVADTARLDDHIVEHEGTAVLLISQELAARLDGARIDCRETSEGPELTISRPRGGLNGAAPP